MVQPLPSPFMPQAAPVLQAIRMGQQDRLAGQQRQAMQTAGGMAAQGQLGPARNSLLQKGMFAEADQIGQMISRADAQQMAKVKQRVDTLGNLALAADTPEKWMRALQAAQKSGLDVAQYQDFGARDMVLAQAGRVQDSIENELKRRKMEQAQAGASPMQMLEMEREKARMRALGKSMGEAQASLPQDMETANRMLDTIEGTLKDPALDRIIGPIQGGLKNYSGGANRAQTRIDQIQGQTFLQAYQSLRGGGQITDKEGSRAEAAIARLKNQNVNDEDYREALEELKGVVLNSIATMRIKAGLPPVEQEAPVQRFRYNPETGELE